MPAYRSKPLERLIAQYKARNKRFIPVAVLVEQFVRDLYGEESLLPEPKVVWKDNHPHRVSQPVYDWYKPYLDACEPKDRHALRTALLKAESDQAKATAAADTRFRLERTPEQIREWVQRNEAARRERESMKILPRALDMSIAAQLARHHRRELERGPNRIRIGR